MSAEAAALPGWGKELPVASEPALPEQIQRHLGSLLAAAYAQEEAELDATGRFTELLARLEVALREARDHGDERFQQLLIGTVPVLRRFAISLVREPTRADDLVQDALLRAWRSRTRFELGTNFEAWMFTILRNRFYSQRRRRQEVQDEGGSYAARLVSAPGQGDHLDLSDAKAALDRLPAARREALVLIGVSGLSYEEAAAVLGCQVGTVKSRVWRAREQLAQTLGYTGAEIGDDAVMLSALRGSGEVGG